MSAAAQSRRIVAFTANRDQPCGSPWSCAGAVRSGERGAYVGVEGGHLVVCAACREALEGGASLDDPDHDPAWDAREQADIPAPSAGPSAEQGLTPIPAAKLVLPPDATLARTADLESWAGPLCDCGRDRGSAFTRAVDGDAAGRWVHNSCGLPAIRRVIAPEPESAGEAPASGDEQAPDPQEPDESSTGVEPELAGEEPERLEVHECDCQRVTKRATIGRTPDGRPTHDHCGGLLREKHLHLAPPLEPAEEGSDDSTAEPVPGAAGATAIDAAGTGAGAGEAPGGDSASGTGTGTDEATTDRDHPAPGEPPGSAGGALRPVQGRSGPDEEGARGAGNGDQDGGEGRGAEFDGHRDPQPVPAGAAASAGDRENGGGRQGAQGGGPVHILPVGQEVDVVEAGAPAITGTLAAFWAQPTDEDDEPAPPVGTLKAFWAQPVDEDVEDQEPLDVVSAGLEEDALRVGATNGYPGERLIGLSLIPDALAALGQLHGGDVLGLVIYAPGEQCPRVVTVSP